MRDAIDVQEPCPPVEQREEYPMDPDFPQLRIASDPRRMLEILCAHLRPLPGRNTRILECRPFHLFTMAMRRTLAPVLSAQTSSAVTGRTLVMYGRNSSTPFAETALDLVPAAILCVHLNHYE